MGIRHRTFFKFRYSIQRGEFAEAVTLKAADNTEFKARPTYSYKVIKNRAIDVVFDNKHIGRGSDFMSSLEDNIFGASYI